MSTKEDGHVAMSVAGRQLILGLPGVFSWVDCKRPGTYGLHDIRRKNHLRTIEPLKRRSTVDMTYSHKQEEDNDPRAR